MYPSLRGGAGNPGSYETFFGEVDDIAAAYEYANTLPYVDAGRIYLAGHSTGGTLALLAAEYIEGLRCVFSFGPASEIHGYDNMAFDTFSSKELELRSPIYWLKDITCPTFVIEGYLESNCESLMSIQKASKNDNISCFVVYKADHFTVLGPVTNLLAKKILADTGSECNISLTSEELNDSMAQIPYLDEELAYYRKY